MIMNFLNLRIFKSKAYLKFTPYYHYFRSNTFNISNQLNIKCNYFIIILLKTCKSLKYTSKILKNVIKNN